MLTRKPKKGDLVRWPDTKVWEVIAVQEDGIAWIRFPEPDAYGRPQISSFIYFFSSTGTYNEEAFYCTASGEEVYTPAGLSSS